MPDEKATLEAVGEHYDSAMMLRVREMTRAAIQRIAAGIVPSMVEEQAMEWARTVLREAELLRGWHGIKIRFGRNTLKTFSEASEPDVVLGENDIFFVDIGPVWRKWEGDGGATFAVGNDKEMARAARDVRVVFERVRDRWLADPVSGQALYAYAAAQAADLGWELNLDMAGHRLADFPHAALYKGALADFPFAPSAGLWVLEIQIRHPERPFGAFFEDLLIAQAGTDREREEQVDADLVRRVYEGRLLPEAQVRAFRNGHRMFATRTVNRGAHTQRLERAEVPLTDVSIHTAGGDYDLYDYFSRNRVASLLVLTRGRIAFERHEFGNDESSRWMSMSMAKSISTTLVGAAIHAGAIGSVDESLTRYLPQLAGTAYDGVSIRHVLQMTSGVRWNDTHTDPRSERCRMLELQIQQQPDAILRYVAQLPRVAAPGTVWNYSTGETHVVGALLRAATGRWAADYLSEKIWSKLGMESDASWWLEAPAGLEVAGSGVSATLRDYGRFGLFILNDGVICGERVLPDGWVQEATAPRKIGGTRVDYGYM